MVKQICKIEYLCLLTGQLQIYFIFEREKNYFYLKTTSSKFQYIENGVINNIDYLYQVKKLDIESLKTIEDDLTKNLVFLNNYPILNSIKRDLKINSIL